MARPDKVAAVAELTEEFRSSAGAVLTDYRGLTVKQLQELRRALGDNASYAVVKNTLTKLAAREAGVDGFDDLLIGPSAIAFIKGDPVEAAKGLRDFARTNAPLVIKGGVLDGNTLTVAEISRMADLESREVLLAKLAGTFNASLQNAVSLFSAPLSQMARLTDALRAKVEAEQGESAAPPVAAEAGEPADAAASERTAPTDAAPPPEPAEPAEPVDSAAPPEPAESSTPDATAEESAEPTQG
jgi:large subunit ribosomal protein L10